MVKKKQSKKKVFKGRAKALAVIYGILFMSSLIGAGVGGNFNDMLQSMLWILGVSQLLFIPFYMGNQAQVASEVDDEALTNQHTVYKYGSLLVTVVALAQGDVGLAAVLGISSYIIASTMISIRDKY